MIWQTSRRKLESDRPLVMGILNITPDSFSDGGKYLSIDSALARADQMQAEGADIIDIGGESSRPGGLRVETRDEIRRTQPIVKAIADRHSIPISIDTTRFETALAALDAGAEIINDISGLRFDDRIAELASETGCGLVLMHSRGSFETMHSQEPVEDIISEVITGLHTSIDIARDHGVQTEQIVLDVGLGFGKAFEQNLELIAKLDKIVVEFGTYPVLVGASRKSFIGKVLNGAGPDQRLGGSLCAAIEAVKRGAAIIRVHDVKQSVDALAMLSALRAIK